MVEEVLRQATEKKTAGNAAMKAINFEESIREYAAGIDLLKGLGEDISREVKQLLAILHSNSAIVFLKMEEYERALLSCDSCLALNPELGKAKFNHAKAVFGMRRYEEAKSEFVLVPEEFADAAKTWLRFCDEAMEGGLFWRQLLPGRDIAVRPIDATHAKIFGFAQQMQNFMYVVGDLTTRECVVVDPCWDVSGVLRVVQAAGMKLVGVVVTHYHFDHTGGPIPERYAHLTQGQQVVLEGVATVVERVPGVKVYVNPHDIDRVVTESAVPRDVIEPVLDGDERMIGRVKMVFHHTPGHTPGAQCIEIIAPETPPTTAAGAGAAGGGGGGGGASDDVTTSAEASAAAPRRLITGDTLFIGSCGRLDLDDCDAGLMHASLQEKLARRFSDDVLVFPGHNYGGTSSTIGRERAEGLLRPITKRDWVRQHGGRL